MRKAPGMAGAINLRVGPLSLEMSDAHLRSIEPPIAIVVSIGRAIALPPLSLPNLGVSSLDLGRLWQHRRPLFLCAPHGIKPTSGRAIPQYGHFIPARNGVNQVLGAT
jgi:hypothetical protein